MHAERQTARHDEAKRCSSRQRDSATIKDTAIRSAIRGSERCNSYNENQRDALFLRFI